VAAGAWALPLALARPPVTVTLGVRRLNGEILQCELSFADEVSALVLKGLATRVRSKDADIADIWRCHLTWLMIGHWRAARHVDLRIFGSAEADLRTNPRPQSGSVPYSKTVKVGGPLLLLILRLVPPQHCCKVSRCGKISSWKMLTSGSLLQ
jgi:hypothetical protein